MNSIKCLLTVILLLRQQVLQISCSSYSDEDEDQEQRRQIEQKFLKMLNMHQLPSQGLRAPVSEYMMTRYSDIAASKLTRAAEHNYDVFGIVGDSAWSDHRQISTSFIVSKQAQSNSVRNVELTVDWNKLESGSPHQWRLRAHICCDGHCQSLRLASRRRFIGSSGTTHVFDVSEAFRTWIDYNSAHCRTDRNLHGEEVKQLTIRFTTPRQLANATLPEVMLVVYDNVPDSIIFTWTAAVRRNGEGERLASIPNNDQDVAKDSSENELRSLLSDDTASSSRRFERSAPAADGSNDHCQLHSWYVDFAKMNWGRWILTPKGFHANYCAGSCSASPGNNVTITNHAYIKGLYMSYLHESEVEGIPPTVCVPVRLSPINLLYHNGNGSIIIRHMAEMVADSCACL